MAIEIKNASFAYPNGFVAVENVTMTIEAGERVAILGQNGAGKTTTVKMMNGLYRPSQGDVFVNGINTKDQTAAKTARIVGYVFQNPDDQIFNNTVRTEIEYMPRYFKLPEAEIQERIAPAVELCDLKKYLKKNPFDIPFPIRKFVAIASVIATQPKYIILDEPTAGQDKHGTELLSNMINVLQAQGVTIITITHDMEFAANNFHRIILMAHKNVIADGDAREVFWNEPAVEDARIKKPVIGELAKRLALGGNTLFIDEMVEKL